MTAADLTARERELLEKLLAGQHAKDIAREAALAPSTIGYRMKALKDRIGVRTLVQLGAWAERHGLREGQG